MKTYLCAVAAIKLVCDSFDPVYRGFSVIEHENAIRTSQYTVDQYCRCRSARAEKSDGGSGNSKTGFICRTYKTAAIGRIPEKFSVYHFDCVHGTTDPGSPDER